MVYPLKRNTLVEDKSSLRKANTNQLDLRSVSNCSQMEKSQRLSPDQNESTDPSSLNDETKVDKTSVIKASDIDLSPLIQAEILLEDQCEPYLRNSWNK